MPNYICTTCGVQHANRETVPETCAICADERQYINPHGQQWTTLDEMEEFHNVIRPLEPGLTAVYTEPRFAIGQRGLLVKTASGNILWDCISYIDDITVKTINALGGIEAIAISHPHFYDSMIEWSRAFGDVPIYLHTADREWVMHPHANIVFWDGSTQTIADDLTLIRCGGHFPGSSVLHWPAGAEGRGALLTADTMTIVADKRYVTFMYSYPNLIPLPVSAVEQIVNAVEPFSFDRLYGGWSGSTVQSEARNVIMRSAERYVQKITD